MNWATEVRGTAEVRSSGNNSKQEERVMNGIAAGRGNSGVSGLAAQSANAVSAGQVQTGGTLKKYVGEEEAAQILGLKDNQFRRLGLKPAFAGACNRPKYDSKEIMGLVGDPRVEAVRPARRPHKKRDNAWWNNHFRHHDDNWKDALANGCAMLSSRIDHSRHMPCRQGTKAEVEDQKRMLVELLCKEGFLVDAVDTFRVSGGGTCWSCKGTGKLNGAPCKKCRGTGVFRPKLTKQVEFRFVVDGRPFTFRLRDHQIDFRYSVPNSTSPTNWGPVDPVVYPVHRFTEGRQSIRWILDDHLTDVLKKAAMQRRAA